MSCEVSANVASYCDHVPFGLISANTPLSCAETALSGGSTDGTETNDSSNGTS